LSIADFEKKYQSSAGKKSDVITDWLKQKEAKEEGEGVREGVLEDTSKTKAASSSTSKEKILTETTLLADIEALAAIITRPIGGVVAIGVGASAKSVLKRVLDRRFVTDRLEQGNIELQKKIRSFD